ncbi:MAG: uroporphyrinogen-III C-methyltransferase [Lachnospiraceae bacterium]|nr:uroporphyrinogen-III C-methyltransferase [Lachnospiraceae bacterium]MBQ2450847.1 uroporphyrinogen-III C-methyltransferase [Lachnospiraceae bacterium]MEE0918889.1 uroporphyrinogen-III C-methyltransferase [Lachnospiraceae bacterium]
MKGKVTLIGAGPGDVGLLTLKGREALKHAEVVIYDRLVGDDVLKLIPKNAEKIDAGKESANHTIPQERINEILLEKALEGKNTIRLKGGDCFLFGRGGEELELLAKNDIDFEVIPGITSALAVPAYAGIPITHRDFVSSVHIITGHQKKNEPVKIDFDNCVSCKGTLVFLMGVSNMKLIMDGLMEHGMSKDMPSAVIEQGTRPRQRKVIATVGTIVDECKKQNIKSPAIIVVGEVCILSNQFDWFSKLPLKGKEIVVTRPKERQGVLSDKLKALGAHVIECPCIETKSLVDEITIDDILNRASNFNWIVFTSPAGVKSVMEPMKQKRYDARKLGNLKIAVIGKATGEELEKYGIFADIMPLTYGGKKLGEMLAKEAKQSERVLLLRAKKGAEEILLELDRAGLEYEDYPVYETFYQSDVTKVQEVSAMICDNQVDYVTFTSASTVEAFVSSIKCSMDCFTAVCIGEKTRLTAQKYGMKIIMSRNATTDDLVQCIVEHNC